MAITEKQAETLGHILDQCVRVQRWSSGLARADLDEEQPVTAALVRAVEVIGEASGGDR